MSSVKPSSAGATARSFATYLSGRFIPLMAALLVLSLVSNVLPQGEIRVLLIDLALSAAFLFAVRMVGRHQRLTAIVLALPAFVGIWSLRIPTTWIHEAIVFTATFVFLTYLTALVLREVLRDEAVTSDTIVGAVCVYFLLGVTWGNAYALMMLANPEALAISPELAAAADWHVPLKPITPLLQHYSFNALTTLGMDDVTAISGGARTLTTMEAVTGQLYLAILIARLVGMHTTRSRS